ncbi:MAG: penicillin-binding protein 1C, partial [Bacteroidetes bacterium]
MKKLQLPGIIIFLCILFWFFVPDALIDDPLSTVIYDRNGELIGARISTDQQWRFPPPDSLPDKYTQSVILFEDRFFYLHPGINPASLMRAAVQNIGYGRVVSGGSTLTMQVIRLSRGNRPRNLAQKCIEILLAFRLELTYTKEEILAEYAARAPFGGNVVGLEAASWRYFATNPFNLTWA